LPDAVGRRRGQKALYERMGFVRTGERTLPGDVNDTREFRYERDV
jgi:hypothetical protein